DWMRHLCSLAGSAGAPMAPSCHYHEREQSRSDSGREAVWSGRLPRLVAADEVGYVGEARGAEQAGRDGGPVAAGTVGDDRAGRIELAHPVPQLAQRDVHAVLDAAHLPFARTA